MAVTRPCVIPGCDKMLNPYANGRRVPDELCSSCYAVYADQINDPWLKYLKNQERGRRMRIKRRLKAGIDVRTVSLDALQEKGLTIAVGSNAA